MADTILTNDMICKAALAILDNELQWMGDLHRGHEQEYSETNNGYKKGSTVSIRRPVDFTVRSGATMDLQDTIEGKVQLVVNQQKGVDFDFSSQERTLSISQFSERYIRPAMTNIVNDIAADVMGVMYQGTYNWAGTAGQDINSFSDFLKGVERLDEMTVPKSDRSAVLSPTDYYGLVGSQSALLNAELVGSAYKSGKVPMMSNVKVYESQVVKTHTNGTADNTTPLVDGAGQTSTYASVKDTWTQSLVTDGWDSSATITAGTVFTIDGVFMVNSKTKESTGILQQFVVKTAVTADETTSNDTTLTIAPPIITSGPHQTVDAAPANDATIAVVGSSATGYKQNLLFHKNAMALAVVPLEMPDGTTGGSRHTHNGLSVRFLPVYDGVNDVNKYRFDILYGRELIDPRLITRLSGTS